MVKDTMLAQKKCVPCEAGTVPLTPAQSGELLRQVPGWEYALEGRAIKRRFNFDNFRAALAFVNRVGELAEAEGHHPDFMLGWGYAECVLWTHSIVGLHENDFIMASKINQLT
jgi:4a-hydroxytetrahydrobiopterin dehydratase